jgi:aryl-alcohol dehydrogenase-like predicted oxidoreductase
MNYRTLGRTRLDVSEIGFGAWGIGGSTANTLSYGPTDDAVSKAALERAYEQGVTFFDTADLYGDGRSEALIGEVFKARRDKIVIATKAGFLGLEAGQDFSVQHLKKSLEASLTRLRTDYVDLYQLHDPSIAYLEQNSEILEFLEDLKRKGTIRDYGISVRSPDEGLLAVRKIGFACIQVNFNMVDQRAIENGFFELCEEENVGIICRTPLCFGFLTGKYASRDAFHAEDHRNRFKTEQIERWANAHRLFSSAATGEVRQTHAQLAIRYCLSYEIVSTVIPGMLKSEEVDENIEASHLGPLAREDRRQIESVYQQSTFYTDH